MKGKYLFAAILLLVLQGCSGFMLQSNRETLITESISPSNFMVTFCGNAYMSQDEAEKYAMQRACELTLTKGYTHFMVQQKKDESEICYLTDMRTQGYSGNTRNMPSAGTVGPQSLVRPNVSLKIRCYKSSNAPQDAIDAQKYLDENFPGLKFKK